MTVCETCGSSDVLIKAWVNPNDDKQTPIPLPWDKDAWCEDCQCVVDLKEEEEELPTIGFRAKRFCCLIGSEWVMGIPAQQQEGGDQ